MPLHSRNVTCFACEILTSAFHFSAALKLPVATSTFRLSTIHATMADSDTMELRARLADLPQELYDTIFDFTFTAEPGIRYLDRFSPDCTELCNARPLFRVPDSVHLLHVDRTSRNQFARSYYGGDEAVFVAAYFSGGQEYSCHSSTCCNWLESLPPDHRAMIRDVRFALAGRKKRPLHQSYVLKCARFHFVNGDGVGEIEEWTANAFGKHVKSIITFGYEDEVTSVRCYL